MLNVNITIVFSRSAGRLRTRVQRDEPQQNYTRMAQESHQNHIRIIPKHITKDLGSYWMPNQLIETTLTTQVFISFRKVDHLLMVDVISGLVKFTTVICPTR